jgi:putative PIN family toxin of toxin-antitoxin system
VLDTNVLVSAFISPDGPPGRILRALGDGSFIAAYSAAIVAEYREVLARPRFAVDHSDIDGLIEELAVGGWAANPVDWPGPLPDETDRKFLEAAVAVGAWLVTGNARHFPDRDWIVTPARFCEVIGR